MTETAVVAIVVALISTMGVKALEFVFSRIKTREQKIDSVRTELQAETAKVEAELKEIKAALEDWKLRYYELRDEKARIESQLTIALSQIERYERDVDSR